MIVLDASVLIAYLDATDAQHERAVDAISHAGDEGLAASPVTIAEALAGPARGGRLDAVADAIGRLGVHEIAVSGDASRRLASLRAATGLRLPDCCVLLAAEVAGASALSSFDHRLRAAARASGLALHPTRP